MTPTNQDVACGDTVPPRVSEPRLVLQVIGWAGAVLAGLWILHRLAMVVLLLVLAALFAYVLAPLVHRIERPIRFAGRSHRVPRGAAIAAVYVLLLAGGLGMVALLLPRMAAESGDLLSRAPVYAQSIMKWEAGESGYYARMRMPLEVRSAIDQSLLAAGAAVIGSVQTSLVALAGALSHLPSLILVPILAFFLLKDVSSFRRSVVTALPHRFRLRGHRLLEALNGTLAAYIRAQLLACLLVAVASGLGFAALRVPDAVLLGVLAGALEFIPLVGPLLLAVIAAFVAALQAPMLAVWSVGFLAVLRVVEDYVIYPRLMRRGTDLHALTIILAVLAGAELGGILGMFLAVPAVAMATVVGRHVFEWYGTWQAARPDAAAAD